jgi:hypothetical protein
MDKILEKNMTYELPRFHLLTKEDSIEEKLIDFTEKKNLKLIELNGEKLKSRTEFFKKFSLDFEFPDYFIYNWDSFKKCLKDLSWMPYEGYIIIILSPLMLILAIFVKVK